jgi:hypothetical protein
MSHTRITLYIQQTHLIRPRISCIDLILFINKIRLLLSRATYISF